MQTMLVRAVATELGVPFLCVRASVLRSKWFGESEKMVSAVFSLAEKLAPCVLFFDEIDGLLTARAAGADESHNGKLTVRGGHHLNLTSRRYLYMFSVFSLLRSVAVRSVALPVSGMYRVGFWPSSSLCGTGRCRGRRG